MITGDPYSSPPGFSSTPLQASDHQRLVSLTSSLHLLKVSSFICSTNESLSSAERARPLSVLLRRFLLDSFWSSIRDFVSDVSVIWFLKSRRCIWEVHFTSQEGFWRVCWLFFWFLLFLIFLLVVLNRWLGLLQRDLRAARCLCAGCICNLDSNRRE